MARVYIYVYTRGKVTLLWYKLRYSAIRGEDGDEEEEEEEGWRISQELLVLIIVASRPPLLTSSPRTLYPLIRIRRLSSFFLDFEEWGRTNFNAKNLARSKLLRFYWISR